MKIILTGATGFVGFHVLAHLLANPDVAEVTCLTRRPIEVDSPKVTTILQEDFAAYDPLLLDRLADHDACIWALGGKASDLGTPDAFTRITHTFTLALAEGVACRIRAPFTFCYLSGMGADPSETATFPWEKLTRHLKGRTEKDLARLQGQYPQFCAHCFRPGGILPDGASPLLRFLLAPIVVGVGELADAMIAGATDASLFRHWPIIGNNDIKRLARAGPSA
jgi:hypothetical protein